MLQNYFSCAKIKILIWQRNIQSLDRVSEVRACYPILAEDAKALRVQWSKHFHPYPPPPSLFPQYPPPLLYNLNEILRFCQMKDKLTILLYKVLCILLKAGQTDHSFVLKFYHFAKRKKTDHSFVLKFYYFAKGRPNWPFFYIKVLSILLKAGQTDHSFVLKFYHFAKGSIIDYSFVLKF